MVTQVYFQTATFCLSGGMARMYSSMVPVPGSIMNPKILTTAHSTVVNRSSTLRYRVMFLLNFSQFYDADKSDGCTFSDILDNQWVGKKSFETWFGRAPVSRWQITACKTLFLAPIETLKIFYRLSCNSHNRCLICVFNRGNFSSLFFEFSSPDFPYDVNIAEHLLAPLSEVKDLSTLLWVHACWAFLLQESNRHFCLYVDYFHCLLRESDIHHCLFQESRVLLTVIQWEPFEPLIIQCWWNHLFAHRESGYCPYCRL